MKEQSFTRALGDRAQTLTEEQDSSWERCQDRGLFLGKGNHCFGKPDNCAGRKEADGAEACGGKLPLTGRAPST